MSRVTTPRQVIASILTALPWLEPFTGGPSPAVWPWLFSAVCGCLLVLLARGAPSADWNRAAAAAVALTAWAAASQASLRPDVLYLGAGLLLVLAAAAARDADLREAIFAGLLAAAVISAVVGLIQYFGGSPRAQPWINIAPAGEAYGNLRQPNQFASLCSIGMASVFWGMLRQPLGLRAALIALLAVGSAASVSRTGFVQCVLLVTLAGWWGRAKTREAALLCTIAACAYAAGTFGLPTLLEMMGETPSRTLWARIVGIEACHSRTVLWSNVARLIQDRPLTGWGWGELDYAHFITPYVGARFCEILDNAHNLPLHLAVELGVPVAGIVCIGGLAWAYQQRPWREQVAGRQLAWAVLAVILIHSMLEYPLWYGPFQIAFGAALGCLFKDVPYPGRTVAKTRPSAVVATAAAVGFALSAYAGWDYWRASQAYLPPEQRREAWKADPISAGTRSWLFSAQARFAQLTLMDARPDNAAATAILAREMLHYSPEPRVVERLVEADTMLGNDREAISMLDRFRTAYPGEYRMWRDVKGLESRGTTPAQD